MADGYHHDHGNHRRHRRAGITASLANWRESGLPPGEKLRLALRNTAIKIRKKQRCCGHPGEPGC